MTTEEVPWASSDSRFTREFEEMTAYLAEITDRTTVTKMMGIAWRTVGRIVERVIERRVDPSRLEGASRDRGRRAELPQAPPLLDGGRGPRSAEHRAEVGGSPEARETKGTRFVVLKKPEDLSRSEKQKLSAVQETNQGLYRAYLLKQALGDALDYLQPARARSALADWLAWASRSRLKPFVRVARTIRKHFEGIIAYVKTRLTNGLVEGLKDKLA